MPHSNLGGIQNQIQQRFTELTDFNSPFFQQYRGLLGRITPTEGTNTALAGLQAGGGNFANSQFIAGQRQKAFSRRREDFLNTSTSQFALGAQQQATGLLGQLSGNAQFMAQLEEQRRQFDESQTSFWEDIGGGLLNIAGGVGGFLLGNAILPGVGGFIGAGIGSGVTQGTDSPFQPSDIRLKENILKAGKSPSGINIYEFNFKGDQQRYRGVMAHEVPEVTKEINGIKYVDYSKIDVELEEI